MKKYTLFLATLIIGLSAMAQNPFLEKQWNTPFGVPPFNRIKYEHYMPAIEQGIKMHNDEINAIVNSKQPPTFANTIEALEKSGNILYRVRTVLSNLESANTSDELQEINRESSPKLTEHYDNIYLNEKLFARVKAVYDNRSKLKLKGEQAKLLQETYKNFVRNGALVSEDKKPRLREINARLAILDIEFGNNVLKATNGYYMTIDNAGDLKGLPQNIINAAADAARNKGLDGKWIFGLNKTEVIPFIQYAENRALRRQLYQYYLNRCNGGKYDNNPLIDETVALRGEKAAIMGYPDYASYVLDDNMAKTPENVYKLLNQLWTPALEMAKREQSDIQAMINKEGNTFTVQPWDWWYYSEKVRNEKYNLSDEELKPYFEVSNVREGVFNTAHKLYGLNFKKRPDVPVYQKDVDAYEVTDASGKLIGLLYLDYFTRPEKRSGAWMTNYIDQRIENGKDIRPVVSLNYNFPAPSAGEPALINWDDVTTFFHEFGHGLHGLLSKCTYASLSGTAVPRDFVELPSQIMENWASEPEVLKVYARHYKTGEVIPESLIKKMQAADKFNQGFATTEYLAASILDMDYHVVPAGKEIHAQCFEKHSMDKIGLIDAIPPRYNSTFFQHIFSGGYSAGYYAYIWAEVLDADAFSYFSKNGIFNKATADSFRKNILERGGTDDAMKLYKQFTGGKEPSVEPLLERRGLK
ncbi:MAG TPA: M3 family metallopeptidase [Bacteroidales bacterium]|nr:M3 family metallopeptidase [Bacteroidales bacterium]HPT02393.1 M3 family metallopeptidase [Bacteroidales bacterium]